MRKILVVEDDIDMQEIYRSMFEKEKDYPAFVDISQESFSFIVEMVTECQTAGILRFGPSDLIAVHLWGAIHGLATLLIEDQLSSSVLENYALREILISNLNLLTKIEITSDI